MEKVNPDNVHNELIFPTRDAGQDQRFMALDEAQMRTYENDFSDVTGS